MSMARPGPFEAYAKQSHTGLMMGLEYATDGTMEVDGRKLVVIEKDTQLKPDIGKAMLEEAYGDDEVDLAIGPVSSGVALAMLPVAEEYEKTPDRRAGGGRFHHRRANWNRYIFRTSAQLQRRTPSPTPSLSARRGCDSIATLAQDYAFGRDGVSAFQGGPRRHRCGTSPTKNMCRRTPPTSPRRRAAHLQRA